MRVNEESVDRPLDALARLGAEASYLAEKGRTAYGANTLEGAMLRNAGERILMKVGIVTDALSREYTADHPDVDWAGFRRLRELETHHEQVNADLMWAALTERIPKLLTQLGL